MAHQRGGSGGGGGAYSKIVDLSLTSGGSISYSVGLGGVGGATAANGANSWFNGTSISSASVSAEGGKRGLNFSVAGGGGAGGLASQGIGTTKYSGGSGFNASLGPDPKDAGGGGGSAAGPNGAGTTATSRIGAAASSGSWTSNPGGVTIYPGAGGTGATASSGSRGSNGSNYGGGAGGGEGQTSTTGGDGGQGVIIITYYPFIN